MAKAFSAVNPEVVSDYHARLDTMAKAAADAGLSVIAPRLAWEATRSTLKIRMSNGFQAALTAEWQMTRPQWSYLIRNGAR